MKDRRRGRSKRRFDRLLNIVDGGRRQLAGSFTSLLLVNWSLSDSLVGHEPFWRVGSIQERRGRYGTLRILHESARIWIEVGLRSSLLVYHSEAALKLLWNPSEKPMTSEMTSELLWNCSETALKSIWKTHVLWNDFTPALKLLWNPSEKCMASGMTLELLWNRHKTALNDCNISGFNSLNSPLRLPWNWP